MRVSQSWYYWHPGLDNSLLLGENGCPVHHRMFSSIPGLFPLDDSSASILLVTTRNISRHCYLSLEQGEQNWPWLRTSELDTSVRGVFEMSAQTLAFSLSKSVPSRGAGGQNAWPLGRETGFVSSINGATYKTNKQTHTPQTVSLALCDPHENE